MFQVFGKTIENLRQGVNIELITSQKIALKRFSKPTFKQAKIFGEDLGILFNYSIKKPILSFENRPSFLLVKSNLPHFYIV